jgi:toxin-antitoxin system PIN domain toxin
MILTDVNVLIYAFRSDSRNHSQYREWLESIVNGPEAYAISPQILCSFIRIVTHPRVFCHPSNLEDAVALARVLRDQPHAVQVAPHDRHWMIFETLCRDSAASGNLVQDAWFAALAIESGCEWITVDRDYARFKGLRWRPPF